MTLCVSIRGGWIRFSCGAGTLGRLRPVSGIFSAVAKSWIVQKFDRENRREGVGRSGQSCPVIPCPVLSVSDISRLLSRSSRRPILCVSRRFAILLSMGFPFRLVGVYRGLSRGTRNPPPRRSQSDSKERDRAARATGFDPLVGASLCLSSPCPVGGGPPGRFAACGGVVHGELHSSREGVPWYTRRKENSAVRPR